MEEVLASDIFKLLLSLIVGTLIGMEREHHHKPVGIRTLSLVCISSTFITILAVEHAAADLGRVLAGLVTGIGFLGAGAVIAKGKDIKGLTTAASIWALAMIGIGIGLGKFLLSGFVALLVYVVLVEGKITKRAHVIKPGKTRKR